MREGSLKGGKPQRGANRIKPYGAGSMAVLGQGKFQAECHLGVEGEYALNHRPRWGRKVAADKAKICQAVTHLPLGIGCLKALETWATRVPQLGFSPICRLWL